MAHFAKIENRVVTNVISVGRADCLDASGNESEEVGRQFISSLGIEGDWMKSERIPTKNCAGIGYIYHPAPVDGFSPPKPFPSWTLDGETCQWIPPVPEPEEAAGDSSRDFWAWNEEQGEWVEVAVEE